uniref:Uncharacterized protein n=1 Tax=Romanomermis culicivorax TaxID=13658 RepID=A0A915IV67_ROMCU
MNDHVDLEGISRGKCLWTSPKPCLCSRFQRIEGECKCGSCGHVGRMHSRTDACNNCSCCIKFEILGDFDQCLNCGCSSMSHMEDGTMRSITSENGTMRAITSSSVANLVPDISAETLALFRPRKVIDIRKRARLSSPGRNWGGKRVNAGRPNKSSGYAVSAAIKLENRRVRNFKRFPNTLTERIECGGEVFNYDQLLEKCRDKFSYLIDLSEELPEEEYFLATLSGPIINSTGQLKPKMYYYNSKFDLSRSITFEKAESEIFDKIDDNSTPSLSSASNSSIRQALNGIFGASIPESLLIEASEQYEDERDAAEYVLNNFYYSFRRHQADATEPENL